MSKTVCPLHEGLDRKVHEINNRLWRLILYFGLLSMGTAGGGGYYGARMALEELEPAKVVSVEVSDLEIGSDAGTTEEL